MFDSEKRYCQDEMKDFVCFKSNRFMQIKKFRYTKRFIK